MEDKTEETQPILRHSFDELEETSLSFEPRNQRSKVSCQVIYRLLYISLFANLILLLAVFYKDSGTGCVPVSKYAKLPRDVLTFMNTSSLYGLGNNNETERSILWEKLVTSTGEISLDTKWAKVQDLPTSTPFFWDESRSLYVINGHHSVHCLRKIRRWVTISYHNGTQLDSYLHLIHCMDHLLQNIICEADDTPMYTSPRKNATTGLGQQRMCRSWDKLEEWASQQTACFSYLNETQGVGDVMQRFRYCPKESNFLDPMREFFGYQKDWFEELSPEIDSMPPYWEDFENNSFM